PGFASITVTVLPLGLAVTPTAGKEGWQALIAAARFVASTVVSLLIAKVPAVALLQAFEPSVPAVTAPQVNPAVGLAPGVRVISDPGVVAVRVTVPLLLL